MLLESSILFMDILNMQRKELIDQLKPFISNRMYHSVVDFPTPNLKALLTYYVAGGKEEVLDKKERPKVRESKMQNFIILAPGISPNDFKKRKRGMFIDRLITNVLIKQ